MRTDNRTGENGLNGYFTLEAAFLVPAAFFLIAFIIHAAFLMYGRCLMVPDAYLPAMRAGYLSEDEDAVAFVMSQISFQTGGKYFGSRVPVYSASKDGKHIVVETKSETNRKAFDLANADAWRMKAGARAIHIDVPKRIRRIDRIADIAMLALRGKDGKGNGSRQTGGD